jgi:predicted O-methyltransferase YrrM
MLARSVQVRSIVEFGTSFGISTLHLAAALRDNGGGRLIGSEFEPTKIARARENLGTAGLSDLVEIREGDALQTLARDLPDSIDLVFLDGAKSLYSPILSLLEGRLRSGALIVADNVFERRQRSSDRCTSAGDLFQPDRRLVIGLCAAHGA